MDSSRAPTRSLEAASAPNTLDEHANLPLNVLQQIRRIVRAAQRHSQLLEKATGLPGSQLWALQEVVSAPGLRVSDLAAKMHLHVSTTSNLVERLINAGLVLRVRGTKDQRSVCLFPTESGQSAIAAATLPTRGLLPEVLHQMPEPQLHQLFDALELLLNRLDDSPLDEAFKPLPFTE